MRPVLFFCFQKCCFQACWWLKDQDEAARKGMNSKMAASDREVWKRLRPLCGAFVAKQADFNGPLARAVYVWRQLYFCEGKKIKNRRWGVDFHGRYRGLGGRSSSAYYCVEAFIIFRLSHCAICHFSPSWRSFSGLMGSRRCRSRCAVCPAKPERGRRG